MQFEYQLNPRKIALFLTVVAIYLVLQSLFSEYLLVQVLGPDVSPLAISLIDLFSVNAETTIPTWYATILLFSTAVILAFITSVKIKTGAAYRFHWLGLSLVFLYLSIDEGAAIHELFSDPLQERFHTSGYLAFGWLLLFVPLLLLFVLAYLRFLWQLPVRTRNLFILAGLLYVGGAVVVEGISANLWDSGGGISFAYLAIATVEEFLELIGVITFIFTLLSYCVSNQYTALFSPTMETADATPAIIKKLLLTAVILILAFNMVLFGWAQTQKSDEQVVDPRSIPFYQTVSEQYANQGVIILGINELIEADNPAAVPFATSLLTLFDDVMVVTLPDVHVSIAFASSTLPFDQETLAEMVRESGEEAFVILDNTAVRAIAENAAVQP